MNYFFGNERNAKGLCATPNCQRKAVQTFVYGYCDECFDTIVADLSAGRLSSIVTVGEGEAALQDPVARPADI